MRILITTQVFPPEIHPTALMVKELAEHLACSGNEVEVVTGYPHHGPRQIYPGYTRHLWEHSRHNSVSVLRTWHAINSSRSIVARSVVFATQSISGAIGSALSTKPDIIVVFGPPLFGPCLATLVAKKHRAKLVNVIHDLHPDIAIKAGIVKNPLVIAVSRAFERYQYKNTDLTIVLTDGFKQLLMVRGVQEEKIAVLPVWLDPDEIKPQNRANKWRLKQGIALDKIVVLYAGTIGWVSGAEMVVDTAKKLESREDILFLFIGDGAIKNDIEKRAAEEQLTNMKFMPFQPRHLLSDVQATADISLVTLAPGRGRTSVPSKVQGYMAAGRPIIAAVGEDSDTGREISLAKAGVVTPAGDQEALAAAIVNLADSPALREEYGKNARLRLEEHFAKDIVLEKFRQELESLLDR